MDNKYLLIPYRPDIDGLRAIAVLSVIAYHAFPKYCTGGFIGVDIFFVISGYLISQILFKNFSTDNFCIRSFYARRIKRIFPALALVLAFCLIGGWFILTDPEYLLLAKHIQASTLFISNFVFSNEAGYFDISAHFKPLMHLWSLSIEEQFYIIWPLLLYIVIKRKLNVVLLIVEIIIISLFLGIVTQNKITIFYFPWCRFWELASGALLAYVGFNVTRSAFVLNCISLLGLSCVLFSVFAVSQFDFVFYYRWNSVLPMADLLLNAGNLYALLPVIGTLMIIMAGEHAFVNRKILSHPICVGLGLISYPLYLWHWALISFSFIMEGARPSNIILSALLAISLFLSWMTYTFIEKPIKSNKDNIYIPLMLIILLGIIGIVAHSIIINNGYTSRKANLYDKMSSLPQFDSHFLAMRINCSDPTSALSETQKHFSDPFCAANSREPKFLVIGNSHALSFAYSPIVHSSLDMAIATMGGNSTFPEHKLPSMDMTDVGLQKANEYRAYINRLIKSYSSIEYVIIVATAPDNTMTDFQTERSMTVLDKQQLYVNGYVKIINTLLSEGKKVILVMDFPTLDIEPNLCVNRAINLSQKQDCLINKAGLYSNQKGYRELINSIHKQVPSLLVYDPTPAFCDKELCYGKRDHILYYGDEKHLNLEGSKRLFQNFEIWLKVNNISLKSKAKE